MTEKTQAAPLAVKLLTAEHILNADDLHYEDVPCPEWAPKGTPDEEKSQWVVRVRNLTAEGRGLFIQKTLEQAQYDGVAAEARAAGQPVPERPVMDQEYTLVALTAINEDGTPMFTPAAVAVLARRSALPIKRCAAVAQRISGLNEDAKAAAAKS